MKEANDWGEDAVDELVTQYKAAEVVYERQPGPLGNFVRIGKGSQYLLPTQGSKEKI